MESVANGSVSEKGGAGLGLLLIALHSNNSFSYDFVTKEDQASFFTLSIEIPVS